MINVGFKEYQKDLQEFCQRHNQKAECRVYTSPMENDSYHKEYCYSDGATFYEINDIVYDEAKITMHGLEIKVPIAFYRTEYFSTDNGKSKFFYKYIEK